MRQIAEILEIYRVNTSTSKVKDSNFFKNFQSLLKFENVVLMLQNFHQRVAMSGQTKSIGADRERWIKKFFNYFYAVWRYMEINGLTTYDFSLPQSQQSPTEPPICNCFRSTFETMPNFIRIILELFTPQDMPRLGNIDSSAASVNSLAAAPAQSENTTTGQRDLDELGGSIFGQVFDDIPHMTFEKDVVELASCDDPLSYIEEQALKEVAREEHQRKAEQRTSQMQQADRRESLMQQTLQQQAAQIHAFQQQAAHQAAKQDAQMRKMMAQIQALQDQMKAKDKQLKDKDKQLEAIDDQMKNKDKQLEDKIKQLEAKDDQMKNKDEKLKELLKTGVDNFIHQAQCIRQEIEKQSKLEEQALDSLQKVEKDIQDMEARKLKENQASKTLDEQLRAEQEKMLQQQVEIGALENSIRQKQKELNEMHLDMENKRKVLNDLQANEKGLASKKQQIEQRLDTIVHEIKNANEKKEQLWKQKIAAHDKARELNSTRLEVRRKLSPPKKRKRLAAEASQGRREDGSPPKARTKTQDDPESKEEGAVAETEDESEEGSEELAKDGFDPITEV